MNTRSIWLYIGLCWILGEELYVSQTMILENEEYADLCDSRFSWSEIDECNC